MNKKHPWKWTLIALIPVFLICFPIYYVFVGGFETLDQIYHQPPYLFPPSPTFEAYSQTFSLLRTCLLNSVIITVGVVLLVLIVAPLAAFALSKLNLKHEQVFRFIFLFVQMIPATTAMIPLYLVVNNLGLLNTFTSVILVISAYSIPFTVILLSGFMQSFPKELIESAQLDGATLMKMYWKVVLPLSKPALTTAAIFAFLGGWNNFIIPLTLLRDDSKYPLSIGLFNFVGAYGTKWNGLMAGSALYAIPAIIVVIIGSKFLVSGLTSGAFKE